MMNLRSKMHSCRGFLIPHFYTFSVFACPIKLMMTNGYSEWLFRHLANNPCFAAVTAS